MLEFHSFTALLKHHWRLISATTIIAVSLSLFLTIFIAKPKYDGSVDLLATNVTSTTEGTSLEQILQTYKGMIKTPTIIRPTYQRLVREYHYTGSQTDLKNSLDVVTESNSPIFSLVALASSPRLATAIVETTADTFEKRANKLLSSGNIQILTRATQNQQAVSPNMPINLMIGLFSGLLMGILLSLWLEINGTTIRSAEYVTAKTNLNVLGQFPHHQKQSTRGGN